MRQHFEREVLLDDKSPVGEKNGWGQGQKLGLLGHLSALNSMICAPCLLNSGFVRQRSLERHRSLEHKLATAAQAEVESDAV